MSGAVTLDDQPVRQGVLTLTPTDLKLGTSTGAPIIDGRYEIAGEKGPKRGVTYRAEISSVDRTNLPVTAIAEDLIPAEFNRESKLQVTVPVDATQVDYDFKLNGRPQP